MKYVLCGNPNVGKTTFLNSLTGLNEHVGNWHGVTVDFKEKEFVLNGQTHIITDLPGLYSLTSFTYEESVARDYFYQGNENFINLIDSNNLVRNLYLTLQLLESGKRVKLCLNFANELKKNHIEIDQKLLSKCLKTSVCLINCQNKNEVNQIFDDNFKNDFDCPYYRDLPLQKVKLIVKNNLNGISGLKEDFVLVKLLEQDEYFFEQLNLNNQQIKQIKALNLKEKVISLRYDYIDKILSKCLKKDANKVYGYSKLDKVILNRFWALPIFLGIIFLIFFITFSSVGPILSDFITGLLEKFLISPLMFLLGKITNSSFILSFFEKGVFSVFITLASFLPQIVLLFFFLSLLEDTGYLSRLAFTFEDIFSKIGLSGRAIFTLLMGFGCNATAVLSSRTLEDKNSKIKTVMLSGFMSCSAKIPIYSVIIGTFFNNNIIIIFFLYLLGVLVSLLLSIILEKSILKSKEQSFIMEMPAYRIPNIKRIYKVIHSNIKEFLIRVSSVLFTFSIIIWFLQNWTTNFKFITDNNYENSILNCIGNFLLPIFKPLGFASSGVVCVLICGIIAKEIIVSTMAIINRVSINSSTNSLSQSILNPASAICFNPISAFSFLVFSLLYVPCITTLAVYKKEIGVKWTLFAIVLQLAVAYLITFIFNKMLILFSGLNFLSIFLSLLIFVLIIVAFNALIKLLKMPKICCFTCNNCSRKSCSI